MSFKITRGKEEEKILRERERNEDNLKYIIF